jgi:Tfp pilus assembly protein FimT
MVTLCRSNDGQHCQGQWHEGSILFTDANADRRLNGEDRLLYRTQPLPLRGRLSFNAFRNRQYLQMTPQGITAYQNGNFTWCPANGDPLLIRQLILSFSGRTRMARDEDGDGVVENSQGKPVTCGR